MNTRQCPICNSTIPADAATCPVCGAALEPVTTDGDARRPSQVLKLGTSLHGGAYSIGKVLGRGGFGVTYVGGDLRRRTTVAIKEFFPSGSTRQGTTVVPPDNLSQADFVSGLQRFLEEAQVLTRFHHPNIVDVYEAFHENGTAYMAMEYLRGQTLEQRLEENGGPLSEAEILAIAGPLVDALEVIHAAGLLHRDIKPDNIILVAGAQPIRPVLIDFGATREFVSGKTVRQSVLLTPGYAPLEQYAEQARRGPFTDIYALAATLYHLATGQQPPAATDRVSGVALKPPRELNPSLSPTFEHAILHGMEIAVDSRPQTAREFFQELSGNSALLPTPGAEQPGSSAPPAGEAPAEAGSSLERARDIARQLQQSEIASAQVVRDRQVCPVCRAATMIDPAEDSGSIRCAVCRAADLQTRVPPEERDLCPACRSADLQLMRLEDLQPGALMRCPACRSGVVIQYVRAKLLLVPDIWAKCDHCGAEFDVHSNRDALKLEELPNGPGYLDPALLGQTLPRSEWMRLADRTETFCRCPACASEFDRYPDDGPSGTMVWVTVGRETEGVPAGYRGRRMPPVDFAKIAHGVPLDEGIHHCPNCQAEYDQLDNGEFVLLGAGRDPFSVLRRYRGTPHDLAFWRALAVGSPAPESADLICPNCVAQLQRQPNGQYSLSGFDPARDRYGAGARYGRVGLQYEQEDWQRIAAGALPVAEVRRLRGEVEGGLWQAILAGKLSVLSPDRPYPEGISDPVRPSLWSVWQAILSGDITRLDPNRPNPYAIATGEHVILALPAGRYREYRGSFYDLDAGMLWVTTRKLLFVGDVSQLVIAFDDIDNWVASHWSRDASYDDEDVVMIRIARQPEPVVFGFSATDETIDVAIEGLTIPMRVDADRLIELGTALRRVPSTRAAG